jgi:hypothetical protein
MINDHYDFSRSTPSNVDQSFPSRPVSVLPERATASSPLSPWPLGKADLAKSLMKPFLARLNFSSE